MCKPGISLSVIKSLVWQVVARSQKPDQLSLCSTMSWIMPTFIPSPLSLQGQTVQAIGEVGFKPRKGMSDRPQDNCNHWSRISISKAEETSKIAIRERETRLVIGFSYIWHKEKQGAFFGMVTHESKLGCWQEPSLLKIGKRLKWNLSLEEHRDEWKIVAGLVILAGILVQMFSGLGKR